MKRNASVEGEIIKLEHGFIKDFICEWTCDNLQKNVFFQSGLAQ